MDLRQKRQEEIICAAMRVFKKNGIENSKMEDIAIEAGIGKATIYGYFTSKRELFEEMIFYNMNKYKEALEKIVVKNNSFHEKLEKLCKHHSSFIAKSVDIFQIININKVLSESTKIKFIEEQKEILGLIKEMVKKAKDKKEIKKNIELEISALFIIGSINQLSNKRIFLDKENPNNIDFRSLINMIMEGLIE